LKDVRGEVPAHSFFKEQPMFMQLRTTKSTLLSLALLAGGTSALSAQERLFEWSGRVDGETRIVMRGANLWTQDVSGRQNRRTGGRVSRALPAQAGQVRVQLLDGRGNVDVIQQPNARNGYTAIVRVRDDGRRADRYRVAAFWQPIGRGRWGNEDDGRLDRDVDGILRWSGDVDDQAEIRIQGRDVTTRTLSGNSVSNVRANVTGRPLTRRDAQIRIRQRSGRGDVVVVQQPSQYNGYTAVLRVRDRQSGYGHYDFDVIW
jgi:hypothetical protein